MPRKTNNAEILLLKKDLYYLSKEVKEIKTNHLVHIQAAVDRVDRKLDSSLGSIYDKLNNLRDADISRSWLVKIATKLFDLAILTITGALIALAIRQFSLI